MCASLRVLKVQVRDVVFLKNALWICSISRVTLKLRPKKRIGESEGGLFYGTTTQRE